MESFLRNKQYTSRLLKGGALLADMRLIMAAWSDEMANKDPIPMLARALPKTTAARVRDTFVRAFRPRFIAGSPPNAWRLAKVLEERHADIQVIRPFYYWVTARAEAPLYDFATDVVYSRSRSNLREIRIEEAIAWLRQQVRTAGKAWTATVTLKVARGMLAALRDFGVLEGSVRKRIATIGLSPEACALIALCLHNMGTTGRELIKHLDWRIFLLGETGVEHLFLSCHQHGWLKFESAGNLCRTEFPDVSFEEYVNAVNG